MPEETMSPEDERYSKMLESELGSVLSSDYRTIEAAAIRYEARLASEGDTAVKLFWLGAAWYTATGAMTKTDPPEATILTALDKAINYWEHSLQLDPSQSRTYKNLLGAYLSKQDEAGARKTAMRWADVDPNLPAEARAWVAGQKAEKTMTCRACGNPVPYDESLTTCPICKKVNPGWVVVMPGTKDPIAQAHKIQAGNYYSEGKKLEAIQEYMKVAEIDPTDATTFNNIGAIHAELGNYDEALIYLRKALDIDPNLGPAKRQISAIEARVGGAISGLVSASIETKVEEGPGVRAGPDIGVMKSKVESLLAGSELKQEVKASLLLKICQATYETDEETAQRFWEELKKQKNRLTSEDQLQFRALQDIIEPSRRKEAKGFAVEFQSRISQASSADPQSASKQLESLEKELEKRSWPLGKGALWAALAQAWTRVNPSKVLDMIKKVPQEERADVIGRINKEKMLSREEWQAIVDRVNLGKTASLVRGLLAEDVLFLELPQELLLKTGKEILSSLKTQLASSPDFNQARKLLLEYLKFLAVQRNVAESDRVTLLKEVYDLLTRTTQAASGWTSLFLLLDLILGAGIKLGILTEERLGEWLRDTPAHLTDFIWAEYSAHLATPETLENELLSLRRRVENDPDAIAWFFVMLVIFGLGSKALDLAIQTGRQSELSQRVRRAWLSLDPIHARDRISPDDMAGDPVGEFLAFRSQEERVTFLRRVTSRGAQSLPGLMWVVPPEPEKKRGLFSFQKAKSFDELASEYVARTPLYSAFPTRVKPEDQFREYLRVSGYGEWSYQVLDGTLLTALMQWGDENSAEVHALLENMWVAIQPEDFMFFTDFLCNSILERCKTFAADPEVLVGTFAAWIHKEWVRRGRTTKINGKDVQKKLPPSFPFQQCLLGALISGGLSAKRRDQIITLALERYDSEPKLVNVAASLYSQDKEILDLRPPTKLKSNLTAAWQSGVIENALPKIREAFRGIPLAGLCDVCSTEIKVGEGTPYSANAFRQLVANGFEPGEEYGKISAMGGMSRQEAVNRWKAELVAQSQTGWLLCPKCNARAQLFLGSGVK